jgi:hypothetical protein
MKSLVPLIFFIGHLSYAQGPSDLVESLQEKIAQEELNNYLASPIPEGVEGVIFESLVPKEDQLGPQCEKEKSADKKNLYEVVVIAQGNSLLSSKISKPGQERVLNTQDLRFLSSYVHYTPASIGLTTDALLQRARDLWEMGSPRYTSGSSFSLNSSLGRELYMEALVKAASESSLSEANLARDVAGVIARVFPTTEEKFLALSALSTRLYRNYNTARNPGFNNSFHNPLGAILPAGDLSLNSLFTGAARFETYNGGVCNDIVEAIAMVGEHLFPDRDVLTVNAGSHFGVLISDGKTNRVIDGSIGFELHNSLILSPKLNPTNLRISKVINGQQKQIAVVDTEMGQVMEAAFETGKKLLKTDADITTIMAHLKKENFGISVGAGNLSDSEVVVVVAKYEYSSERWKSYLGLGASGQTKLNDIERRYQIHFRAGTERTIFRYLHDHAELKFSTGVRLSGMQALQNPVPTGGTGIYDLSASFDAFSRVEGYFKDPRTHGPKLRGALEVEQSFGPTNWGQTSGILSQIRSSDIGPLLRNTTFHLNQVNADLSLEKPLSPQVTAIGTTRYQGSQVGQSLTALLGLNIQAPEGAQLLIFTGYTNSDTPGFRTQHSLIGTPSGGQIGAKYTTRNGIEFATSVRSLAGGKSAVQATVRVPMK